MNSFRQRYPSLVIGLFFFACLSFGRAEAALIILEDGGFNDAASPLLNTSIIAKTFTLENDGSLDAFNINGSISNSSQPNLFFWLGSPPDPDFPGSFPGIRQAGTPLYPPCGSTLAPSGHCELNIGYDTSTHDPEVIRQPDEGTLQINYTLDGQPQMLTLRLYEQMVPEPASASYLLAASLLLSRRKRIFGS
jgi:hypothetical protein